MNVNAIRWSVTIGMFLFSYFLVGIYGAFFYGSLALLIVVSATTRKIPLSQQERERLIESGDISENDYSNCTLKDPAFMANYQNSAHDGNKR